MASGIGSIISVGASLLGGAKGKDKATASQSTESSESSSSSTSGFAALPPAVQDAWLKTYLPTVLQNYTNNQVYKAPPMARVNNPRSVFDSAALNDLQKYSDKVGGIFTPVPPGTKAPGIPNTPMAPATVPTTEPVSPTTENPPIAQAPIQPGGVNGYDGSAQDGQIRTFNPNDQQQPGFPGYGTFMFYKGVWHPLSDVFGN